MKILVVTQQNSGVGYHRLMLPIYFLPKTYALFTDVLSEENLKDGYDILLINRFIQGVELQTILEYKKKYGFKLVVDIDDYWHLDPWHVLYKRYPTQVIIDHIKAADLVTTTHDRLRDKVLEFNKNVEILPNALPYGKDQFTDARTESDKVRFIYAGSITHQKDIEILKNPLKRFIGYKGKIEFGLCGYDDNKFTQDIWWRMIDAYTQGLELGYVRQALPVTEYMNFYNDADACLVPLVDSTFNSMKSNLKLLEAACKKVPVIASNVHPYKDSPIIPINKQTDWFPAIKKVIEDSIYRSEKGLELYEWANENYNLHKINLKRKDIYASNKM